MSGDPESLTARTAGATTFAWLLREARQPTHWAQLMRFGAVGASGYLVNLAVYAGALAAGVEYRGAATAAFLVSLANNFAWNRLWTFRDAPGELRPQALRFVVVSGSAFVVSLALLSVLVRDAGMPKLAAQAAAIVAVTPASFIANKLWSFRPSRP